MSVQDFNHSVWEHPGPSVYSLLFTSFVFLIDFPPFKYQFKTPRPLHEEKQTWKRPQSKPEPCWKIYMCVLWFLYSVDVWPTPSAMNKDLVQPSTAQWRHQKLFFTLFMALNWNWDLSNREIFFYLLSRQHLLHLVMWQCSEHKFSKMFWVFFAEICPT